MWIELPESENPVNTYARQHWTAISTLSGLISCVYRDLHHWRSNQRSQIAEPKLYNWAISSYRTSVMPNLLVMVVTQPVNLNVSWKLHSYSLLRTRSPPGLRLPKRIRNTHPRNFYDLKGKDIDLHFLFFLIEELYCELNYHDEKIRGSPMHDVRKHWTAISTL